MQQLRIEHALSVDDGGTASIDDEELTFSIPAVHNFGPMTKLGDAAAKWIRAHYEKRIRELREEAESVPAASNQQQPAAATSSSSSAPPPEEKPKQAKPAEPAPAPAPAPAAAAEPAPAPAQSDNQQANPPPAAQNDAAAAPAPAPAA